MSFYSIMNISLDAITGPVDNVVKELGKIANNVNSLRREITKDIMNTMPPMPDLSKIPKPNDLFNLISLVEGLGNKLSGLLNVIPSTAENIGKLTGNIQKVDFGSLSNLIKGAKDCDLPICNLIDGILNILDIENCDHPFCTMFRTIRDVLEDGDLSSCDLTVCDWIKDAIALIEDPLSCNLEICDKVRKFLSLNNLKTLLGGIAESAIDSIKQPIIMALSGIVITIIVMFLMLLYLVFK